MLTPVLVDFKIPAAFEEIPAWVAPANLPGFAGDCGLTGDHMRQLYTGRSGVLNSCSHHTPQGCAILNVLKTTFVLYYSLLTPAHFRGIGV